MRCYNCSTPVGPRSTVRCDHHYEIHLQKMVIAMRRKRMADANYREMERHAVKARMRELREKRKSEDRGAV